MAYSADKGEKLLEVQTGRTGMAPPITYEIDGKQYVALMGGMGMGGAGERLGGARRMPRSTMLPCCSCLPWTERLSFPSRLLRCQHGERPPPA